jgi:hypothetical protein
MKKRRIQIRPGTSVVLALAVGAACAWLASVSALQAPSQPAQRRPPAAVGYRAPRAADGHADLNGIWQAMNTANWDIQDHAARQGPVVALGASFSVPAGSGVVEGNELPYQPWAAQKKKENAASWQTLDPEIKCYLPGTPRGMYIPYPFQIVQTPTYIMIVSSYARAVRTIYMTDHKEAPADSWMGWSNGHWEGETLVVDTTGFNDLSWFDRAGNFHSDQLHVVERITATDADHLSYEATIEDPQTFTRPWKIALPIYRRVEKNAQLLEFNCIPFVEDLIYGHLRKPSSSN